MKRFLIVAAVAAGVFGMAMVAGAATPIVNTCTSTYQLTGGSVASSGWDTAIASVQTAPSIVVAKWAKNLRTGVEDAYSVNAISGDTIEYRIVWSNTGQATADTIVLRDYLPSNMTYVSESDTCVNATGSGNASYSAPLYSGTYTAVQGTDATAANGVLFFRVRVN